MKTYHATIETVDQLKSAIDNSRAAGIFKNGETLDEFVANVAAYIAYCEEYGCQVLDEARPDGYALCNWYMDILIAERFEARYQEKLRVYGTKVERDLYVVEYTWPDGSGSWVQCTRPDLWAVVGRFKNEGCKVFVDCLEA